MLNDDGVVALEFDAFLFPIFCEILNSHTGMANHIAWDVAVYRETAFPVAKSRINPNNPFEIKEGLLILE